MGYIQCCEDLSNRAAIDGGTSLRLCKYLKITEKLVLETYYSEIVERERLAFTLFEKRRVLLQIQDQIRAKLLKIHDTLRNVKDRCERKRLSRIEILRSIDDTKNFVYPVHLSSNRSFSHDFQVSDHCLIKSHWSIKETSVNLLTGSGLSLPPEICRSKQI